MVQMKGVKILKEDGMFITDPMKIVFQIEGLSGAEIWDTLEKKYKINIEKTTKKAATLTIHAHIN